MAPRDRWRGSWKGGHEELPWPGFQGARKAPAFAKKLSSPSRRFLPSLKYTPAHHERFLPWVKGRPLSNYHFLVAKTHVTLPAVCPLLRVVRTSSGTLQETVTRSHDMSLQPEAFQGGPKRPPGSSVTCGRRKDLKTRRDFLDEATGERLDPSSRKEAKKLKGEAPSNTPQASVGNDKKLPGQTPSPGPLEEVSVLPKSHSLFTHF
ncbi:uncharacterized protein LOC122221668 isoform X2 [Panthera leo]|uniref:uncharacterized protein LOC122221668 isoform X2 n=1 Tax=Panthera leo TaxID=9689 RepID=UPI001C695CAB|nr:uncharacterized protein LOC122221668 isoform X2 [Panthera leo]